MGLEHEEKPPRAYRELVMVSQAIRCSTNSILIRWSMKRNHLGPRELVMISQAIRCSTNSILIHFVAYLLLRLQETAKIKHLLMAGWSGWPPELGSVMFKQTWQWKIRKILRLHVPLETSMFFGGSQLAMFDSSRVDHVKSATAARLMGHRAQRAFSAAKKSNTWQWTPKISSHLAGNSWSSSLLIYLDPRRFRNV
jgi:hypothetical protein